MAKKKTAKEKPLLSKTEKATIRSARRILRNLTAKWKELEEDEWKGGSEEAAALDRYADALAKEHIDVDSVGCFIILEKDA